MKIVKSQRSNIERGKMKKDSIKIYEIDKIIKQNKKINKILFKIVLCVCLYVKMNIYFNECCEYTKRSENIKTILEKGKINKIDSYCIDCGFIRAKIIYEEDTNCYWEKLNDLVRYHILKDPDGRFNELLENTHIKRINLQTCLYIKRSKPNQKR